VREEVGREGERRGISYQKKVLSYLLFSESTGKSGGVEV